MDKPLSFPSMISALEHFWADKGCFVAEPYDIEKGAGTMNPLTFFRVLGPKPWNIAYVEPVRRPQDARHGDNPYRMGYYFQFQVILKPPPDMIVEMYLDSLAGLGIRKEEHDIRLVEDNWEAPTLGASGVGWEIWLDGNEITQFTYFQEMGGLQLNPISCEITYGLERLAAYIQGLNSAWDVAIAPGLTYKDAYLEQEKQGSAYGFDHAGVPFHRSLFDMYEEEARRILKEGLYLPAYDLALKCSHAFNILDARGAVSVSERQRYIGRVRDLCRGCAKKYVESAGGAKNG